MPAATMTRPHAIRADTIDLQDPGAPSAKDHSRQPTRPNPIGEGAPAPHQAEALKHVELEISEQHGRSPRASADLSGKELQLLPHDSDANYHQDPTENLLRNAGQQAAQDDAEDPDGDDGLDDDMGDKVSSSPSIGDDGGYPVPHLPRPQGNRSVSTPVKKATHSPGPPIDEYSSSPFEETPTHFPLSFPRTQKRSPLSKDHHQKGESGTNRLSQSLVDEIEMEKQEQCSIASNETSLGEQERDYTDARESFDEALDLEDFHHLLLPDNDPLLDNSFDDMAPEKDEIESSSSSPASKSSWNSAAPDHQSDDDSEDISYDTDSRFVDSGWGGECLRETEDIDFEFVYALHTFVATVEGQANATKGDTMVLLDDSNSYWWLVRIVKDSSIGYLPAEHIETPLERLARLNKHRNLDLSQTMLGDQDEDKRQNPLNPLRKAMRRRNVKKVDFAAANSYLEPDDTQFSSSEDEEEDEIHGQNRNEPEEQRGEQNEIEQDATVAPLNTRERTINGKRDDEIKNEADARNGLEQANGNDLTRTSDETTDEDGTSNKSRKGTPRNTDSFFKDDSVETRKINLTPNILREPSNAPQQQYPEPEMRVAGNSLDSLEKDPPTDRPKEEKKKKEKRGMLGGMFKRKDKKSKDKDSRDAGDEEKTSTELARKSPTPKESMESLSSNNQASPHRQTSKLQKQRPANLSPKGSHTGGQRPVSAGQPSAPAADLDRKISSAGSDGSMRLVLPESQPLFDKMPTPLQSKEHSPQESAPPTDRLDQKELSQDRNISALNTTASTIRPAAADIRPEPLKPSPQRIHMDEPEGSLSSPAEQPIQRNISHEPQERLQRTVSHESQERLQRAVSHESQERLQRVASQESQVRLQHKASQDSQEMRQRTIIRESPDRQRNQPSQQDNHHLALAQAAQHEPHPAPSMERLSESPVEVSPPVGPERNTPHQPPPLVTDMSSPSDSSPSPISPPSSPELIEPPSSTSAQSQKQGESGREVSTPLKPIPPPVNTLQDSPASTSASTSRSLPAWSDASLRAYMEDDSEIRDLLIIVHDKSGVVPRKDHPVVKSLFKEENKQLSDIERRLDGLLGDFLARRGRSTR